METKVKNITVETKANKVTMETTVKMLLETMVKKLNKQEIITDTTITATVKLRTHNKSAIHFLNRFLC